MLADRIAHADGRVFLRMGECDGCAHTAPGQCCTFVRLPLARSLTEDETRWVHLHPGLTVIGQTIDIQAACQALDHGRCTLFALPDRPTLCGRYPEQPDQVLDGCAYELVASA